MWEGPGIKDSKICFLIKRVFLESFWPLQILEYLILFCICLWIEKKKKNQNNKKGA